MKAEQVVEMHRDLAQRMDDPEFAYWMVKSAIPQLRRIPDLSKMIKVITKAAYCYRVSDEMSDLVTYSSSQLDATDKWDRQLAPTPCGLARFDKPLRMTNLQGQLNLIHWILWGPLTGGTFVYMFNDHDDPDEVAKLYLSQDEYQVGMRIVSRWGGVTGFLVLDGDQIGEINVLPSPQEVVTLMERGEAAVPSTNALRFLHALFLQMEQKISETEPEHVRSTTRRLAERAGLPAKVTAVRLRRSAGSRQNGESVVAWSHRWLVRGHWRWQAYGEGRQQRRRIWIDTFTKGPDDKPLVITQHVYDVRK